MMALVSFTTIIAALVMCAFGNYSGLLAITVLGPSIVALYEMGE